MNETDAGPKKGQKYIKCKRIGLYILVAGAAIFSSHPATGQTAKEVTHRDQLWLGYFNQTRLTNKFGFWFDIHYRQTDHFVYRPFQFVVRTAVTYYITDNIRINIGHVFANHFPAKNLHTSRPEHRGWQQIIWNQKYTRFSTRQWLRLEERFNRKIVDDELQDGYNFNYRIRYSASANIPLKGKEIVAKTPFAVFTNEVFLNFGGKIVYNTFDQNRFFAGLGYQFTPQASAQLGYMNIYQQEAAGNRYISSNVIRLYFFHNLDLRAKND